MTEFDPHQWEAAESDRLGDVSDKMLDLFGVELLESGGAPVVEFACPKGHGMWRWRATLTWRGEVALEGLPGEARKSGTITDHAFPGARNERRGVCAEPGCPKLVRGADHCDEHGGRGIEAIQSARTRFTCRVCGWSDEIRQSRLLQLYTAAATLGHAQMSLTGQTRRR